MVPDGNFDYNVLVLYLFNLCSDCYLFDLGNVICPRYWSIHKQIEV